MSCGRHDPDVDLPHTEARYGSECPACAGDIVEGDVVYRTDDGWVCETCAAEEEAS